MKRKIVIGFNAPITLLFTFTAFGILLFSLLTNGWLGDFLAIRYTSWLDPMMYIRLFTHSLTHKTFDHFTGNMMMILILGPIIEEKYGSGTLLFMMSVTSVATGLITVIFFKNIILMGASGIVFMLILLSSFVNVQQGTIPLTFILVAVVYLGNEIVNGLFQHDQVSQFAHIIGGLCGACFGFLFRPKHP